jgi:hypothetical protein
MPGPGAGQQGAGGGAKLPDDDPQQRRQPHPEAGRRRARPMAARNRRRISMISLRSYGAVREGLLPASDCRPAERARRVRPRNVQLYCGPARPQRAT